MNEPNYQSIYDPASRAISMIGNHAMQMPAVRFKLQQAAQEAAVRNAIAQAQIANYQAQAGKHGAETDQINLGIEGRKKASEAIAQVFSVNAAGEMVLKPEAQAKLGEVLGGGVMMSSGFGDMGSGVKRMIEGTSHRADQERKALTSAEVAMIGAQSKENIANAPKPFNLSPGAARYDENGQLIVQNPSAASQMIAPVVTETYEATPAITEVTPSTGGRTINPLTWINPPPVVPGTTNVIAPAMPKRTIRRSPTPEEARTIPASAQPAPVQIAPKIDSQEAYDALPSGSTYQDIQGNIRRKR